jgi:hypothetical protein
MKASKATYGIAAALGCAFALLVVFVLLSPSDRDQVTSYADFERDLAEGKVEEVRIDGTTYRYRARDGRRKTIGPPATLASIATMRPRGDARPPRVWCER